MTIRYWMLNIEKFSFQFYRLRIYLQRNLSFANFILIWTICRAAWLIIFQTVLLKHFKNRCALEGHLFTIKNSHVYILCDRMSIYPGKKIRVSWRSVHWFFFFFGLADRKSNDLQLLSDSYSFCLTPKIF